jgi:hypothetical protein
MLASVSCSAVPGIPYLNFSMSDLKIHLQFNMDLTFFPGVAFVPLHWFGIARKHFEGERK